MKVFLAVVAVPLLACGSSRGSSASISALASSAAFLAAIVRRRSSFCTRSVMSRVIFAKPTSFPDSSRMAVIVTLAQNRAPSFRILHPSSTICPSRSAVSSSCSGLRAARSSGP